MTRTTVKQRAFWRPLLNPLLTLIRTKEASGYNDVVSHLRKHKPADITKLRLREVRAWQDKYDPTTSLGEAVGYYQFTKETIDSIVRSSDITWDDKFSPVVQDHMALHLILTRTPAIRYFSGKGSSMDEVVLGVAKIWASFPVPKDMRGASRQVRKGQSFYAGVANNKAYVQLRDVRRAISGSKRYAATKLRTEPRTTTSSYSRGPTPQVPTGATGSRTRVSKSTVRTYQRWLNAMGGKPTLRVDGLVGRRTRAAADSLGRDLVRDLATLQKGGNLPKITTDSYDSVVAHLRGSRSAKRIVEVYQTILNTKRTASRQIVVDGLYGPKTHRAARELGRPILADLKNLEAGRNVQL